jgi:DNA ligase-1
VQGSGAKPYVLKNIGGVYSCSCPAWRNQSAPPERRSCKHLKGLRGEAAELARVGGTASAATARAGEALAGGARGRRPVEASRGRAPPMLLAHVWDNEGPAGLVDEREARRGARVLGRAAVPVAARQPVYFAPEWFTAGLPNAPLDGELWLDRKAFQRTVSIVRRQDQSDAWREIKFSCSTRRATAGVRGARAALSLEFIAREPPSSRRPTRTSRAAGSIICAAS